MKRIPRKLPPRAVIDGFEERRTLSRRRHQKGELLKLKHGWSIRVYEDYRDDNGKRCRHRPQKFLGSFEKLPTRRAALNALDAELALVNDYSLQPRTTITLRQQSAVWIADCRRRRCRPIKPGVIANRQYALDKHVLPLLGEYPVSDVRNGALRTLVEALLAKGLKPSTIQTSTQVLKAVVASVEDADGNQLYPVVWNKKFVPIINPATQNRPTFSRDELQKLVNGTDGLLQLAVIVLGSTGVRISELLGLEIKHFDGSCLRIEQTSCRGLIQTPKTANGYRMVDLEQRVANLLRGYLGPRTSGFVFATRSGRPIGTRNFLRLLYVNLERLEFPRRGFHAFRRFRNSYLRNQFCPPGLLRYWMGHAAHGMSDVYDRSFEDAPFRQAVANKVGVGFEVPVTLAVRQSKPKAQTSPDWALSGAMEAVEKADGR